MRTSFAPRRISPEMAELIRQAAETTRGFTPQQHVRAVLNIAHRIASAKAPAGTSDADIEPLALKEAIQAWTETAQLSEMMGEALQ